MDNKLSLVCSIRRAIPYPCWGPMAWSVLRTIRARVPCQTSVLALIWVSQTCIASRKYTANDKPWKFLVNSREIEGYVAGYDVRARDANVRIRTGIRFTQPPSFGVMTLGVVRLPQDVRHRKCHDGRDEP